MTVRCDDLEAALASGEPELIAAARAHAATCLRCAETIAIWDEISAAAVAMRGEWSGGAPWPAVRQAIVSDLARRRRRRLGWTGLAAAAVVVLAATVSWRFVDTRSPAPAGAMNTLAPDREPLLSKGALREIEHAEADYARAIDRLGNVAASAAGANDSPLVVAQREKLQLLDVSIAELRTAIAVNQLNTQLRQQLLAMYREKRETLEEMIGDETKRQTDKPGT